MQRLINRYGELLTCEDLAVLLRYSSAAAVRQAHATGKLPVKLFRLPGRRPLFASADEVAEVLDIAQNHGELR
jgi:hypothetical protein